MATKSNPSFCGRPGCGVARAVHHILTRACGAFVAPGSLEAHELRRAHLALISTPLPPALDDEAATLRMLAADPVPEVVEDEPTARVGHITDAQLLAEWKARAEELGMLA